VSDQYEQIRSLQFPALAVAARLAGESPARKEGTILNEIAGAEQYARCGKDPC
jgi:hypothetical protein